MNDPTRPRLISKIMRPHVLMLMMALFTFAVEIFLADRKFGVFSGGFGQSKAVDTPMEYALLLPGAVAMHALLFWGLWKLLSRIHRRRVLGKVLSYNCIMLGGAGFFGALTAKFELLSYFSDAISFNLIKSLGGGSATQAFLYGLHQGGWPLVIAGICVVAYLVGLFLMMRKDPKRDVPPAKPVGWKRPLAVTVATGASLLVAAHDNQSVYANSEFMAYTLIDRVYDIGTDVDFDGYSWFSPQQDDAPFDSSRHPYALDIPNNGIDEDGVGGDLKIQSIPAPSPAPQLSGKKPHVIYVILESARHDILGKRIGGKTVAPNLEAIAAQGSVRPSYSPLGFTAGSLKAMFSGRIEPPIGTPSLFKDFKANGYRVSVFSGQAEDFGDIAETVGSRKVADNFVDAMALKDKRAYGFSSLSSLKVDEHVLLDEFEQRFGKKEAWAQPNFMYFNFQSAHFPYTHPGMTTPIETNPISRGAIKAANKDWLARTYWNALAHADAALGGIVADLKRLGVWEDTVLIVSGDHGEALFEDGFLGHGHIINSRQYQTVFITNKPGYGGTTPIGLVDYRAMVHAIAEAKAAPSRTEPILMHIGMLDTPASVGMVDPAGQMTVLSLQNKEVQLKEDGPWTPLDKLDAAGRARAEQLVALWGRERWRRHLSEKEVK